MKVLKKEVFEYVEVVPTFNNGEDSMMNFKAKKTFDPKIALDAGIKGQVIIQFIVNEFGKAIEVPHSSSSFQYLPIPKLKTFPNEQKALINEAIRVIKLLPKWIPCSQWCKKARVSFRIP
jgi:periplasmic protein TonB